MPSYTGLSPKIEASRDPSERKEFTLLFRDDFEDTTPKAIGVAASTAEVTHNSGTQGTVMPYEGAKMLKVADTGGTNQMVEYLFGPMGNDRVTLDCWFFVDATANNQLLEVWDFDGTDLQYFSVKQVNGTGFQYYNSVGAYETISGSIASLFIGTWNHIRMTCDLKNGEYLYATINGTRYDLSPYACNTSASANAPHLAVRAGHITNANGNPGYIDDFRVYTDEVI